LARLRPVVFPDGRADRPAVAVIDPLHLTAILERDLAVVRHDDGVAFVPAARGTVVELRDDPAAVAVEHALFSQRAVAAIGVGDRTPRLLAGAIDDRLAAKGGRAPAGLVGPLTAVGVAGGHPRLVGVIPVPPIRVAELPVRLRVAESPSGVRRCNAVEQCAHCFRIECGVGHV
jgi:hypothetical protein